MDWKTCGIQKQSKWMNCWVGDGGTSVMLIVLIELAQSITENFIC
jgi:hypothetical protein